MLVARRARTSVTNLLVNYRFAHVEALRVARHLRGREAGKEAKRIDPGLMRVMMDIGEILLLGSPYTYSVLVVICMR